MTFAPRFSPLAPASSSAHGRSCPAQAARRRRRLLLVVLGVGGVGLIGSGALASWQVTASKNSGALNAATSGADLLDANGGTFTTSVADLVPGDYFYRYVDVQNKAAAASTFTGTVTATGDLAPQLSVLAETCPISWTMASGVSTCAAPAGSTSIGTGALTSAVATTHGSIGAGVLNAQHVRYKFTFATTAPTTLQGKTGSLSIAVSNTLVGGNDRTNG